MTLPRLMVLASTAIGVALAANASADCPLGCVDVGPGATQCSTASTLDLSNGDYGCVGSAGYVFPAGTLHNKITQINLMHGSVSVSFDEDFTLTGLPFVPTLWAVPGLAITGQGGHEPGVTLTTTASLQFASTTSTWTVQWPEGFGSRDTTLSLPVITVPAGGSFRIHYSMTTTADRPNGSGSAGYADVQAVLGFYAGDILPEHVGSCRGYSDGAVPATAMTWGRVKSVYR